MCSQRYVSDTLKQKKKKIKKIKLYLILFVCILLLSGFIYLLQIPQIQITETKIKGNSFVTTEEIQNKTDVLLNSTILWFIPKRNIFLFPSSVLTQKIKENPAIIDVKINKEFFNVLEIQVTEQEKQAVYCTSFERNDCYYINGEGLIYSKITEYIVPEQEIIIYREEEQRKITENILKTDLYENVLGFIKSSSRYGIPIQYAYLKGDTTLEFHTASGATLLTSRYDDYEKDFNNFIALFDQNVLTKEQLSEIEYIDLRFGNKVFYKNKTN